MLGLLAKLGCRPAAPRRRLKLLLTLRCELLQLLLLLQPLQEAFRELGSKP